MQSPANGSPQIPIRTARAGDADWVRSLIPRLHQFGPPPHRPIDVMNEAEAAATIAAIGADPGEKAVLVAEDPSGERLGFVHLETAVDFFTRERHGHISTIVVAPGAEGRRVGSRLMQAAEQWTRDRGYRLLTLNVFEGNDRARRLYQQAGFSIDTIKYVKLVNW